MKSNGNRALKMRLLSRSAKGRDEWAERIVHTLTADEEQ